MRLSSNKKIITLLVALGGALFFGGNVFGATATLVDKGSVNLYTYETNCPLGSNFNKPRGVIIPKNSTNFDTTYLYFHGIDKPSVSSMCDGSSYSLCTVAAELDAPIIIPETKNNGESTNLTSPQIVCLLEEATQTMLDNQIVLPTNYIVVGHSGGGNFVKNYVELGFTAESSLILDGCYGRWCETIATKANSGDMYLYYGKDTNSTPAGSQAAYETGGAKVRLFEVDADHYAIPNLCFSNHITNDDCQGNVVTLTLPPPAGQPPTTPQNPTTQQGSSTLQLSQYADKLNKLKVDNVEGLIGIIVRGVMGIIGTVALVMMLYGGVTWMTARGNSERTQKARDTILWAGLGIVLIFASYALVDFVFEIFR
ncbi:MAG: hypothetical protein KBD29_02325 [Candidatus Magasanikbacteria bacterium]|nr:hypothetical protein [Candidatus Magasanikbacteria bacterium]